MKLAILLLLLVFSMPLMAADKNLKFAHYSPSCGDWIKDQDPKGNPSSANRFWALGFITAYNIYKENTYDIIGNSGKSDVYLWINNWCKENPLKHTIDAVHQLTVELWPDRSIRAPLPLQ